MFKPLFFLFSIFSLYFLCFVFFGFQTKSKRTCTSDYSRANPRPNQLKRPSGLSILENLRKKSEEDVRNYQDAICKPEDDSGNESISSKFSRKEIKLSTTSNSFLFLFHFSFFFGKFLYYKIIILLRIFLLFSLVEHLM